MPEVRLVEATKEDVPEIVRLLLAMADETQEFELDADTATYAVDRALDEHVYWFLFKDAAGTVFGTCYLQPVHSYWQKERRFYLGGFYITPDFRNTGAFRVLNGHLQDWATAHGGVQIYAHIHEDNAHSLEVFGKVGLQPSDYRLCAKYWKPATSR